MQSWRSLMPPRCTVCAHEKRKAIDEALVLGRSLRDIARQHQVGKDALHRHRDHLTPALVRMVERRAESGPKAALDRLEDLYGRASLVLDAAESEGLGAQSLAAIREMRGIVEILARISGELDERPTVNVLNLQTSTEWQGIRAAVLDALGPYPEAAHAVSAALAGLGQRVVVVGEVER